MRLMAGNVGLDFVVEGPRTGPPIVFIHGFPFEKSMWQPQADVLKRDYYVVRYDVRGHGASDVGEGQYTVEAFVDDLEALLDHLRIQRAVVAGLSMGGYIALRAIERMPDRIRALVLCDTRSEADSNEGKVRRAQQVKSLKTAGLRAFADQFLTSVLSPKTFERRPDLVERLRAGIEATSPLAVAGTLIALAARTDTTPALFGIKVPTLILVGQQDTLTPPSAANAMKEKIPGAELHVIPEAAHLSNLENTDEFNARLTAFLARLR